MNYIVYKTEDGTNYNEVFNSESIDEINAFRHSCWKEYCRINGYDPSYEQGELNYYHDFLAITQV